MADNNGEWTLTALYAAMQGDLAACSSEAERVNCRAVCAKEIKLKAFQLRRTRRLTPGEESVLFSV